MSDKQADDSVTSPGSPSLIADDSTCNTNDGPTEKLTQPLQQVNTKEEREKNTGSSETTSVKINKTRHNTYRTSLIEQESEEKQSFMDLTTTEDNTGKKEVKNFEEPKPEDKVIDSSKLVLKTPINNKNLQTTNASKMTDEQKKVNVPSANNTSAFNNSKNIVSSSQDTKNLSQNKNQDNKSQSTDARTDLESIANKKRQLLNVYHLHTLKLFGLQYQMGLKDAKKYFMLQLKDAALPAKVFGNNDKEKAEKCKTIYTSHWPTWLTPDVIKIVARWFTDIDFEQVKCFIEVLTYKDVTKGIGAALIHFDKAEECMYYFQQLKNITWFNKNVTVNLDLDNKIKESLIGQYVYCSFTTSKPTTEDRWLDPNVTLPNRCRISLTSAEAPLDYRADPMPLDRPRLSFTDEQQRLDMLVILRVLGLPFGPIEKVKGIIKEKTANQEISAPKTNFAHNIVISNVATWFQDIHFIYLLEIFLTEMDLSKTPFFVEILQYSNGVNKGAALVRFANPATALAVYKQLKRIELLNTNKKKCILVNLDMGGRFARQINSSPALANWRDLRTSRVFCSRYVLTIEDMPATHTPDKPPRLQLLKKKLSEKTAKNQVENASAAKKLKLPAPDNTAAVKKPIPSDPTNSVDATAAKKPIPFEPTSSAAASAVKKPIPSEPTSSAAASAVKKPISSEPTSSAAASAVKKPIPSEPTSSAAASAVKKPIPSDLTNSAAATAAKIPIPSKPTSSPAASAVKQPISSESTSSAAASAIKKPIPSNLTNSAAATAAKMPIPSKPTSSPAASAVKKPIPSEPTNSADATAAKQPIPSKTTSTPAASAEKKPIPSDLTNSADETAAKKPIPSEPTSTAAASAAKKPIPSELTSPAAASAAKKPIPSEPTSTAAASAAKKPIPSELTSPAAASAAKKPIPSEPTSTAAASAAKKPIPSELTSPADASAEKKPIPSEPTSTAAASAAKKPIPSELTSPAAASAAKKPLPSEPTSTAAASAVKKPIPSDPTNSAAASALKKPIPCKPTSSADASAVKISIPSDRTNSDDASAAKKSKLTELDDTTDTSATKKSKLSEPDETSPASTAKKPKLSEPDDTYPARAVNKSKLSDPDNTTPASAAKKLKLSKPDDTAPVTTPSVEGKKTTEIDRTETPSKSNTEIENETQTSQDVDMETEEVTTEIASTNKPEEIAKQTSTNKSEGNTEQSASTKESAEIAEQSASTNESEKIAEQSASTKESAEITNQTNTKEPEELAEQTSTNESAEIVKQTSNNESEEIAEQSASTNKTEERTEQSASTNETKEITEQSASTNETEELTKETVSTKESEEIAEQTPSTNETEALTKQTASTNESEEISEHTASTNETEELAKQTESTKVSEDIAEQSASTNESEELAEQTASTKESEKIAIQTESTEVSEDIAEHSASTNETEELAEQTASTNETEEVDKQTESTKVSEEIAEQSATTPSVEGQKTTEVERTETPSKSNTEIENETQISQDVDMETEEVTTEIASTNESEEIAERTSTNESEEIAEQTSTKESEELTEKTARTNESEKNATQSASTKESDKIAAQSAITKESAEIAKQSANTKESEEMDTDTDFVKEEDLVDVSEDEDESNFTSASTSTPNKTTNTISGQNIQRKDMRVIHVKNIVPHAAVSSVRALLRDNTHFNIDFKTFCLRKLMDEERTILQECLLKFDNASDAFKIVTRLNGLTWRGQTIQAELKPFNYAPKIVYLKRKPDEVVKSEDLPPLKMAKFEDEWRVLDPKRGFIPGALKTEETFGVNPAILSRLGVKKTISSLIVVTNIHEEVSDAKLHEVFSIAGHITHIKSITKFSTRRARIEYEHPVEALQAVSMFNGQKLYGLPMKVIVSMETHTKLLPSGLEGIGKGFGPKGLPLTAVQTHVFTRKLFEIFQRMGYVDKIRDDYHPFQGYFEVKPPHMLPHPPPFHNQQRNDWQGGKPTVASAIEALGTVLLALDLVPPDTDVKNLQSIIYGLQQHPKVKQHMNAQNRNRNNAPQAPNQGPNQGPDQNNQAELLYQSVCTYMQNMGWTGNFQQMSWQQMGNNSGQNSFNMFGNYMSTNPVQQNQNMPSQSVGMNVNVQPTGALPTAAAVGVGNYGVAVPAMAANVQNAGYVYANMNPSVANASVVNPSVPNPSVAKPSVPIQSVTAPIIQRAPVLAGVSNTNTNIPSSSNQNQAKKNVVQPPSPPSWNDSKKSSQRSPAQSTQSSAAIRPSKSGTRSHYEEDDSRHSSSKPRDRDGFNSDMLQFKNLPPSVTQKALTRKMEEVGGEIIFAEMTGKGRALVRFKKTEDAARCYRLLHHSKVDGHDISVTPV